MFLIIVIIYRYSQPPKDNSDDLVAFQEKNINKRLSCKIFPFQWEVGRPSTWFLLCVQAGSKCNILNGQLISDDDVCSTTPDSSNNDMVSKMLISCVCIIKQLILIEHVYF